MVNVRLNVTRSALVKDTNPELMREWAEDLNPGVTFGDLRTHSNTKVWWRCAKDPKHVWPAQVRRRAIEGNGCSYCSGLKVLPEDSFAARYPKIAAEWHPSRNEGIDPWKIRPHSNKGVWWRCLTPHEHEWQATVHTRVSHGSGCKQCNWIKNPLSKAFPELAKEWHPTKNGKLTPETIAASSAIRVWWQCRKNPAHDWPAGINFRTRTKNSCPKCRRFQKALPLSMLDVFDPILASQWHPIKNGALRPSDVSPNSNEKAYWICPVDSRHVWGACIRNRAKLGRGCPACARGGNIATPGRSLADRFPEIAKEWHPTKNGPQKLSEVPPGSARRVWWRCKVIPSHEWQATVTTRTQKKSRGLCPFCSGFFVTPVNSLAANFPEIAQQWHPTKNLPLTPDKVKKASGRRIWWLCPANPEHEWQATVKNRTLLGSGCHQCAVENRVRRVQEMLLEAAGSNTNPFLTFSQSLEALRALMKHGATAQVSA